MPRRLVITGIAAAAIAGAVVPAFAQSFPIAVQHDTHNGVSVGFTVNGSPGGGARVSPDGSVCAGLGEDIPVCTPPVGDAIGPIGATNSAQSLPVTVRRDSSGTTVTVTQGGTNIAGATVYNDGQVCAGISLQLPICTPRVTVGASHAATRQKLPVTARHDDTGTAVGVGDVGVVVYPNGDVCPVVSTDNIRCIPTPAR